MGMLCAFNSAGINQKGKNGWQKHNRTLVERNFQIYFEKRKLQKTNNGGIL